jgi:hypothetical protein
MHGHFIYLEGEVQKQGNDLPSTGPVVSFELASLSLESKSSDTRCFIHCLIGLYIYNLIRREISCSLLMVNWPQLLSIRTELEPVYQMSRGLVFMFETCRVLSSPFFQRGPISAHSNLTGTCAWRVLKARIPRCIVRIADDVLAKLV